MVPIDYLALRLIRRWLPAPVMRFLMRQRWFVRPGLETSAPSAAVDRYQRLLHPARRDWSRSTVFLLGYGGFLGVAVELLRRGAAHVVLYDPFAPLDHARNATLLPQYTHYLLPQGDRVLPHPTFMTLLPAIDLDAALRERAVPPLDLVLSSSVYEHITAEALERTTRTLAQHTAPTGLHLHFIDLRDHFFKYPFQMLTFSEKVWRRWLNPPSNLNRWRLKDYRALFQRHFAEVEIHILERDVTRFRQVRARIRPEFLTRGEATDAVTQIAVVAQRPRVANSPP